jgi:hypothetical protein
VTFADRLHTALLGEGQSGVSGQKSFHHILTFSSTFAKLRKATVSFIMSVCLCADNSPASGQIFITFDIWGFLLFCEKYAETKSVLVKVW